MNQSRPGSDPAQDVRQRAAPVPAAQRERELAAVERLYERLGRRPTDAERARVDEIATMTERWRAEHVAGSDSAQ